jgi:hypothetical protein
MATGTQRWGSEEQFKASLSAIQARRSSRGIFNVNAQLDSHASLANCRTSSTVRTMTTVATCSNPAEAMLLKSLLEANNITAYVPDELTSQAAPHFSGSGIHVQVNDDQAATAKTILEASENTTNTGTEADSADDDQ